MHVLDLFNDKDRTFLEGMVNTEGEIVDFPGKRNVRSIGPKQSTDGEVVKLKTPPKPQTLSTKDLAMISDKALDDAYGYGRSVPGPNFGWLANMNSAMFAKRAIDSGVTDIEKISAEIHKGWASAAIGDYKNKLPINPPTPHETKLRRLRLAQVAYNELPEKEKEKDRVVARALLQALSGKEIPGSNDVTEGDVVPMPQRPTGEPVVNVQPASVVPFSQFRDPGTRKLEMWKQKVRDRHPEYGNKIRFVSKDNGAVVSAEIPGLDRSFGVFDMTTETGQVLDEGLRDPKDNPCWKGYHPVGTKKKNGRTVPNCIPNANESLVEGQTEGEATLAKIAAAGDEGFEMIYDGINGLLGTEAQIMLQDMYDDVSREYRLHPDDDFEQIQGHMMDRIQDDYGQQGVAEGLSDTQQKIVDTINKLEDRLKHAKTPEQWDNIKNRIERLQAGLKRSQQGINEFAPDGFNGGDDGEEFNPRLAKMAYDEGVVKGASLADGATLKVAMAINDWDKHDGGIYRQHFAKGFKAGRMDKIRHNNKQYNLNLQLNKDGSISHGEQGVAEGSLNEGQYEMMMRNGQVKKFIAKDDADAKRIAAGYGAKSVIKLKGGVPAGKVAEQGVAEGSSDRRKQEQEADKWLEKRIMKCTCPTSARNNPKCPVHGKKKGVAEGAENLSYIGNCTDDDVIEHIFGDATNFAQAVEEHGDEFTIDDLVVKYDPESDVHSFYYKKQGVAEGMDAEAYKQKLLSSLPQMMRFYEKNVKGWKPSEEQMLAAVETGYIVMKHTGDVKQAGKAVMDELNTLRRMSQGQGVAEATGDAKFDAMMGNIQKSTQPNTNQLNPSELKFFKRMDYLFAKLGQMGKEIVSHPNEWRNYERAEEDGDHESIRDDIMRYTGASEKELSDLTDVFNSLMSDYNTITEFAYAVKDGDYEHEFIRPWEEYKQNYLRTGGQVNEQGVAQKLVKVFQTYGIRSRINSPTNEGINLNEVSDETLINYLTKVHQDALKHKADPTKRSPEKASKSVGGFNRAFNKLDARPRKNNDQGLGEDSFNPMDHKEYPRLADELHAKMMAASQRNDKEEFKRLQAERDSLDARARKGLKENEKEGKPRIRKYTKMRPDGSKAVRYEVLDYRGMRIPGQGTEGFDDPKFAKEFYYRNYDKLQGPVEEQVQEEPIREVAGRYWCKNEKRWKNVE